jgi:hypothetical protein
MGMEEHIINTVEVHAGKPADAAKGKPTRKPKGKSTHSPTGKRSLNLSISVDTYERLMIHAMRQTGGNISDLVERLAGDHLREYHLTRTATTRAAGE